MEIFSLQNVVIQLIALLAVVYGIYLVTHENDLRTSREKRRDIRNGTIFLSIGSVVIFLLWFFYFITYKSKI